jgi:hypothetical protein
MMPRVIPRVTPRVIPVTEDEISKQGIFPTVAPVKPYTLLALILSASWRPSSTAFRNESVSFFRSDLALQRPGYFKLST